MRSLLFLLSFALTLPLYAKVVIVGGGAAGLLAADRLRKAGIPHVLFEGSRKIGGRISSRSDRRGMDLTIDEGATLINSSDKVTLSLIREFNIPYVERFPNHEDHWAYMLDGQVLSQQEFNNLIFTKDPQALRKMAFDEQNPNEKKFTHTTIAEYLTRLNAGPQLSKMIEAFFWSEYGRRLDELNIHVLYEYLSIDLDKKSFHFIPYYDEAYTLPGGTDQIVKNLYAKNTENIRTEYHVTDILEQPDGKILVKVSTPNGLLQEQADQIIFAAPLNALKSINVKISELTPEILNEARSVTYGTGMKLHMIFAPGFRELYKFRGIYLTETGEQMWTSSQGQNGQAGLITVLTGPKQPSVEMLLKHLEKLAPGVSDFFVGIEITTAPFTYSGPYQSGEPRFLKINQLRSPRWITIGEASSDTFQGYVEGAFESANRKVCADLLVSNNVSP